MHRPLPLALIVFLILVVVVAWAMTGGGSSVSAQAAAVVIAIARMEFGQPPDDFDFARTGQGGVGQWRVVNDFTTSEARAIEQSDADRTDYRFPLAIQRSFSAKNVDASVKFKSVAGAVDQAGGIAVRLIDPDNYYIARANALEDNVRFYRVLKGRREQLEGANLRVTANEWHSLDLKADGQNFIVTYDGKTLFTATDRTFTGAGKFALWTKADSIAFSARSS